MRIIIRPCQNCATSALSDGDYSSAFNAELVRLEPGDHSVPHIEPWSHLLYFLSGTGDVTINGETQPVATGTVCQISAGQKHSLRNLGKDDMDIVPLCPQLTILLSVLVDFGGST